MNKYKAKVLKVLDGDTVELLVHLGFRIQRILRVRFLGIDTPETYKPTTPFEREAGLKVKEFVISRLNDKDVVLVTSDKDTTDKYGRYLGRVLVDGKDVVEEMLALGLTKANLTSPENPDYIRLCKLVK